MTMHIALRATSLPYSVRKLMRADERAILGIIESVRREFDVQRRAQSLLEPSDLDLYTTYQQPHSAYFVATFAGIHVGGAGIAPLARAEATCELQRMYVSAPHRRRGIGQLLLNECLRRAGSLGFRRCYAETISEMKGAISFYEANGFQRLMAPLGSGGHGFTDCWLLLDLRVNGSTR